MTYYDDNDQLPTWMIFMHPAMLMVYVLALWMFGIVK